MARSRGMSVRARLALSYAGVIVLTGAALLTVVWAFLLRYVPSGSGWMQGADGTVRVVPSQGDLVRAFTPPTVAMFALLVVCGLVGGWFLAGRMLRPLGRLHEAAGLAASGSLSHRVSLPGRGDEFTDLADAFDRMLAELERHVGEQQRFAANASHELRTPLAITRTMLEVAAADPSIDREELIARLTAVNTRAIGLTESLLLLSRADRAVRESTPVDLALLAEDAIETLAPLAASRGVVFDTELSSAVTAGSPTLLQQLATNLVHNAIVHNLPSGGGVAVRTSSEAEAVVLVVGNNGAELSEQEVAHLTEPFQHGARTTEHGEGVGLGLAIAASIVRAHDGTLSLAPLAGGGLVATVRLPAAPAREKPPAA
ncbi:HAMP domain-containing histidine kinase [Microbacterium sp. KUDC0406]|uniref:sensor histidine kinase n=1 Tax=Microbacterium sp. KUDC0406 TaxID=2909588 RepID=UPI001F3206AA|nr:HAMP domain-containing sensor histidine kinase [Microbacterium sp. KUDC0406]UJP09335.1 HAMP domain-containing histidine kinase [Microbacterium sp. KUDC0406]